MDAKSPAAARTTGRPKLSATGTLAPTDDRLKRLRAELARRGLDGFILPRSDEHQGEYVAPVPNVCPG